MMERDTLWQWDTRVRRYRNTTTGKFLSETTATRLRDRFTDARATGLDTLTRSIMGDALPGSDEWATRLTRFARLGWQHVEETFTAQYMAGHGGWRQMGEGQRRELGRLLDGQRSYWDRFIADAGPNGKVKSLDGLTNRAGLYNQASTGFYDRGRASSWDINLPGYPGDGATECLSNCRCHWEITQRGGVVYATWKTGSGDICNGCTDRAKNWSPYTITRAT